MSLPPGWAEATVDDLGEFLNGMAFKPTDWDSEGLGIVRIQNLTDPQKPLNKTLRPFEERYRVSRGDILVSWSATLDAFVWDRDDAILNQHIFKVTPSECVEPRFLYHLLRELISEMVESDHLHGSTMKHINRGPFLAHKAFVPPLAEQRRIVAKLDALTVRFSRARAELHSALRYAKVLPSLALDQAYRGQLTQDWREACGASVPVKPRSDEQIRPKYRRPTSRSAPAALPDGWSWLRLPQMGELDRGRSRHRPRNDPRLMGDAHPFVQTGEIRAAKRYLTGCSNFYSDFGLEQSRKWPLGTVCITIAANIAETAILGLDACFPDSVVGFEADQERTTPEYVEYFMRVARADLARFAPATAQKNINLDILAEVLVPVAPLNEQKQIVDRLDAAFIRADRLEVEAKKALALIDRLEAAILAKAFRGELVPQDPNDEPASVLLERIRARRAAEPKAKRGRRPKLAP